MYTEVGIIVYYELISAICMVASTCGLLTVLYTPYTATIARTNAHDHRPLAA